MDDMEGVDKIPVLPLDWIQKAELNRPVAPREVRVSRASSVRRSQLTPRAPQTSRPAAPARRPLTAVNRPLSSLPGNGLPLSAANKERAAPRLQARSWVTRSGGLLLV